MQDKTIIKGILILGSVVIIICLSLFFNVYAKLKTSSYQRYTVIFPSGTELHNEILTKDENEYPQNVIFIKE